MPLQQAVGVAQRAAGVGPESAVKNFDLAAAAVVDAVCGIVSYCRVENCDRPTVDPINTPALVLLYDVIPLISRLAASTTFTPAFPFGKPGDEFERERIGFDEPRRGPGLEAVVEDRVTQPDARVQKGELPDFEYCGRSLESLVGA